MSKNKEIETKGFESYSRELDRALESMQDSIEDREYNIIKFRNGYAKNAPTMLVEYGGYDITDRYEIKLGKIIEVNYE